ncbi:hypothetical protein CRE_06833 [Caenorhabditis remanei]|uniref:SKP1 component POZ domain-containing protein n=1 Tax=Caenorhabditis remanei TaxID=31234 RepID=E3MZR1_CAERE|nr:hypothetical protein CRE_06833 [Caenorhabditis remanei]
MNSTTTRISTNYMLQSTDGKSTWISEDAVKHCQNVRRAIETTRQTAIQVNAADAELKQIVRFCEHYKDGYTLYQPLTQWDQQFFSMEDSKMMDLLMAATELLVAPIMNICFQTLKNKTRQMSLEEKLKACGLCYSILSKDGQMFELTENAAKLSGFISSANPILLDVMAAPTEHYLEMV